MKLAEILYQKTNDVLRRLAALCGGCSGATRKDDLVRCIHRALMIPESLRQLWQRLDYLSQKAVAAAYHNDGEFNRSAFVAQYGAMPDQPKTKGLLWWSYEPILLDLFIYDGRLPSDLMPMLADLVPPPEKFQLEGLSAKPTLLDSTGEPLDLICTETEQAGLHDLMAYLRLVDQGQIKISARSTRATIGSIRKILETLVDGDFLPLPEKYRAGDTIRPFGLDVFAQEAGLAARVRGRNELQLTEAGREFYQNQKPKVLLAAFETWTQQGSFDELSRIPAVKGQNARGTFLTRPASRREPVIEALSWCPVSVWIDIQDFYDAIKIWHFDFEVETTRYSNLYVGDREYGLLYNGDSYWTLVKGLYINAILWEYLGTIGALDLLYIPPEEAYLDIEADYYWDEYYSPYDGLKYFRINNLGAYLLGQAGEYIPSKPLERALFAISDDLLVTLTRPGELTPNDRHLLEQVAIPQNDDHYRLDTQRLLISLEEGGDLEHLTDFLKTRHPGPLPQKVLAWLEKVEQNSQAFKTSGQALFIEARSDDLVEMILADPVLQKFCKLFDRKTLVIPASKEKAFRTRLKELEFVLLS